MLIVLNSSLTRIKIRVITAFFRIIMHESNNEVIPFWDFFAENAKGEI